jgi:hydroxypyruvate isomerase
MPRFCANLTMLFTEVPLTQRFAAAAQAGFNAVEILFPYDHSAHDMRCLADEAGVEIVLINTPAPDWDTGGRGCAAIPGKEARFRTEFLQALTYAEELGARFIHVMSGLTHGPEAQQTFIENLRWATREAAHQSLTIEPINPLDMPGYFLSSFALAAEILDAVNAGNLHLQFDAYHAHRISNDVPGTWGTHGHRAAHVQVAGAKGRHEPVNGEIGYTAFFRRLDDEGYRGVVSGEYTPKGRTEDGLGWVGMPE